MKRSLFFSTQDKYRVIKKKRPIVNCQITAFMSGIRRNEEKIKSRPWQDASNGMQTDSQRYLVPEKIDNLGVILTLIERAITPLLVHES